MGVRDIGEDLFHQFKANYSGNGIRRRVQRRQGNLGAILDECQALALMTGGPLPPGITNFPRLTTA